MSATPREYRTPVADRAIALLSSAGNAWRMRRYDPPQLYLHIGKRDYEAMLDEARPWRWRVVSESEAIPETFMGATIVRLDSVDAPMIVTGQVEPTK